MGDRDIPDSASQKKRASDKKTQQSYLVLGITFAAVGIGLSFGDSSAWIVFLVLGITFMAVSASPMAKKRGRGSKRPPTD